MAHGARMNNEKETVSVQDEDTIVFTKNLKVAARKVAATNSHRRRWEIAPGLSYTDHALIHDVLWSMDSTPDAKSLARAINVRSGNT